MPKQIPIDPKDEALLGFLKGLPLFKSLNPDEIQMLFPVLNRYRYEAGEAVFKEGDVGDSAYIVVEGCLSLDRMGRRVKTFAKGEVYGIVVLLGIEARIYWMKLPCR
jgi:CRP-like cAMP-binding protein